MKHNHLSVAQAKIFKNLSYYWKKEKNNIKEKKK